jgi:hypothetical protein
MRIRSILFRNNTCWRDEDLWAFLRPCVEAELEKHRWPNLSITFQPRRGQRRSKWRSTVAWCGCSGTAYFCGSRVVINVPTRFDSLNEREKVDLAAVISHELWHINTRRGGKAVEIALRKSVRYGRPKTTEGQAKQTEYYAWAAKLPLRKVVVVEEDLASAATVAAPRRSLIETRAEKAASALSRWEAELIRREKAVRRAKRKIAAARRKVTYYAKKTAVVS